MSWDVSVLRFSKPYASITDISEDEQPLPLGSLSSIHAAVAAAFPGVDFSDPTWGRWTGEVGSIEFNIGDGDPVEGMMLHVRARAEVVPSIVEFCQRNGWRAIDGSEGEFLDDATATSGIESWISHRNRAAGARSQ
jgi:hypothetical protein